MSGTFNTLMFPGANALMMGIDPEIADIAALEATVAGLATTADMTFYCAGTSGDDANDGLTLATAKATLGGVFALIPTIVRHNVLVNLSETIDCGAFEFLYLTHYIADGKMICIDGGADLTVVADNAGAAWLSDSASETAIGLSTAGWTPNAYRGYMVEIVAGDGAGQVRMIQSNTATALTPCQGFSPDTPPVAGYSTFRIVKPATRIVQSGVFAAYFFAAPGISSPSTNPSIKWQRVTLGDQIMLGCEMGSTIAFSHIVSETIANKAIYAYGASYVSLQNMKTDIANFWDDGDYEGTQAGVGCVGAGGAVRIGNVYGFGVFVYGSVIDNLYIGNSTLCGIRQGNSVFNGTTLENCATSWGYAAGAAGCIANDPDVSWWPTNITFAPTKFSNSAGVGLLLNRCSVEITGAVDCSDASSHGIEAKASDVQMVGNATQGVPAGTGNTGAGLYAHAGSKVFTTNTFAPTLTGTVGDVAVSDPTVEDTTWAAVDGGSALIVAAQQTLVSEV